MKAVELRMNVIIFRELCSSDLGFIFLLIFLLCSVCNSSFSWSR